MKNLDALFREEKKIAAHVREIAEALLELSEFVNAKGALDLAGAEVLGRRVRRACDGINDEVHEARKALGVLMLEKKMVSFKKAEKPLHEMENDLSLVHGDIDAIGRIAEGFYEAPDREAAFENLNSHYRELVRHVQALLSEQVDLAKLV